MTRSAEFTAGTGLEGCMFRGAMLDSHESQCEDAQAVLQRKEIRIRGQEHQSVLEKKQEIPESQTSEGG